MNEIKCPYCGSTKWDCWDEQTEWFENKDGTLFQYPVGYLKCGDCNRSYLDYPDFPDATHIGEL
jgi:phage terminase large subunit GpA-like protein